MADEHNPKALLGLTPKSAELVAYIEHLSTLGPKSTVVPEVRAYPDAVYYNYYTVGLSLLFAPAEGYKLKTGATLQQLDASKLRLDGIDIYNASSKKPADGKSARALSNPAYSPFPMTPIALPAASEGVDSKPRLVQPDTTAKTFVEMLGEPERKGGGSGPSSGSIGIWLEWSKEGLMVEFGGDESRGPQAWEKGKDAVWSVLSLFVPKQS